ncbi:hypothetical protein JHK82_035461 [Glycine max]|nr:hypothetical protein JHK85_036179 [Glycine max]KAG5112192.1 hypothetical protein JHK82_035461 [Glycine max]KAG5129471.1 hypothetical protein JHK84_035868 [Glycine max]
MLFVLDLPKLDYLAAVVEKCVVVVASDVVNGLNAMIHYMKLDLQIEVRLASEPCGKAKTNLNRTLVKILASEKNHKCKYNIPRTLVAWNLLQFDNAGHDKCTDINVGEMDFDFVPILE